MGKAGIYGDRLQRQLNEQKNLTFINESIDDFQAGETGVEEFDDLDVDDKDLEAMQAAMDKLDDEDDDDEEFLDIDEDELFGEDDDDDY